MTPNIIIPSPYGGNELNRPKQVIVHAMGEWILHKGKWYHAVDFLMKIGLSTHFLVTPSGVGIRTRDDSERASHAKGYNTDTLGIEFLVPGVFTKYQQLLDLMKKNYLTEQAYDKGVQIVKYWYKTHQMQNVTTHHRVSPKRKEDPGVGFPNQFFVDINS